MGVFDLYTTIVHALSIKPTRAIRSSLDELATQYNNWAYIGGRKTLASIVQGQAEQLAERIAKTSDVELERLMDANADLASVIRAFKKKIGSGNFDPAKEWFDQPRWKTDSGVFPDLLLGTDNSSTIGNGALLELKDSKGDSISSFNSTIPTRFKSLIEIKRITHSGMVLRAAQLYDYPLSAASDYLTRRRLCFYFVRTKMNDKSKVRLGLVEGSFFETLPKDQLLEQVWGQILNASGMPQADQPPIIEFLGRLEQTDIAQSRQIEKASVKPRFRIMTEVHHDANLHVYPELGTRTFNLILKREPGFDEDWLACEMERDGIKEIRVEKRDSEKFILVRKDDIELQMRYLVITHKRNGEHIVLQYELPK